MATKAGIDLAAEYSSWLQDRISLVRRGEEEVLSTPFLDPFNDGVRVFVEREKSGFILHDGGDTLDNLSCLGVRRDSEHRKGLISRATEGCGVRVENGRLETRATTGNLPQRTHFLISAIMRLNDLWMSAVPRSASNFFELVSEFFEEHNVLCNRNVTLAGKTVEHPIDFMIPLPKKRERLIKLIGTPSTQTAKIISFTWMDLQEARPDAERVVLLNDVKLADRLEEKEEEESRRVNEQTLAILQGYSTAVYRWSERGTAKFEHLFKSAA